MENNTRTAADVQKDLNTLATDLETLKAEEISRAKEAIAKKREDAGISEADLSVLEDLKHQKIVDTLVEDLIQKLQEGEKLRNEFASLREQYRQLELLESQEQEENQEEAPNNEEPVFHLDTSEYEARQQENRTHEEKENHDDIDKEIEDETDTKDQLVAELAKIKNAPWNYFKMEKLNKKIKKSKARIEELKNRKEITEEGLDTENFTIDESASEDTKKSFWGKVLNLFKE